MTIRGLSPIICPQLFCQWAINYPPGSPAAAGRPVERVVSHAHVLPKRFLRPAATAGAT